MIHFNHVTKQYENISALKDAHFTINQGEMLFITGPSGAGKTTILRLLMGYETPTHGQVYIDGSDVSQQSGKGLQALRRQIGFIHQAPYLLEKKTIYENVALPLLIDGYRQNDISRRVQAALDKVGLLHCQRRTPSQLSAGQQQRIGIARSIVHRPRLLLADEPTGNLDPALSEEIFNVFRLFNQVGVTVVIVTHDLYAIAHLNMRIINLREGQIIGSQQGDYSTCDVI